LLKTLSIIATESHLVREITTLFFVKITTLDRRKMLIKLGRFNTTFLGHHFKNILHCAKHFVTFYPLKLARSNE